MPGSSGTKLSQDSFPLLIIQGLKELGGYSGPLKIPGLFSSSRKNSYLFVNYEGFKIRGGANSPVLSIPSPKKRQGDFKAHSEIRGLNTKVRQQHDRRQSSRPAGVWRG